MSAPAFTPGPWWAEADGCIAFGKHNYVKLVSPWVEDAWRDDPEAAANAHLIAAAPELYEALEALVACWPEGSVPAGPVCVKAAKALAKARGEA